MRTIHKDQFEIGSVFTPPSGSIIVHFTVQRRIVTVWYDYWTENADIPGDKKYMVLGTGHRVPEDYAYIGTAQDDPFVWHLFYFLEE